MTKRKETLTRTPSGAVVGRPRKHPPEGAAPRIRDLVANGYTIVGVASAFGVDSATFKAWLKESDDLQNAFDEGRERERHALHNRVYMLAMTADDDKVALNASIFLLTHRHEGYVAGASTDAGNRPQITINMPGARPMSDFVTIENGIKNGTDSSTQSLPDATTRVTRGT